MSHHQDADHSRRTDPPEPADAHTDPEPAHLTAEPAPQPAQATAHVGRRYTWAGGRLMRTLGLIGVPVAVLVVLVGVTTAAVGQLVLGIVGAVGSAGVLALSASTAFTEVTAAGVTVRARPGQRLAHLTWAQLASITAMPTEEPRWRYTTALTTAGGTLRFPGMLRSDLADLVAQARRRTA